MTTPEEPPATSAVRAADATKPIPTDLCCIDCRSGRAGAISAGLYGAVTIGIIITVLVLAS